MKNIEIPNSVIKIENCAFECSNLKSIIIPTSVSEIEHYAFSGCSNLKSIKIPNKITTIKCDTFHQCSNLENIEIPSSVTAIENLAFYECYSLKSIKIPNGVIEIYPEAFCRCFHLESVFISNSVIKLPKDAFIGCSQLKSISVEKGNPNFYDKDGILFNNDSLVCYPCGRKEDTYTVPNGIKKIKQGAFDECHNIINVNIPSSVNEIEDGAFLNCSKLESVSVEKRNPYIYDIDGILFQDNCLIYYPSRRKEKMYTIPIGITEIRHHAFWCCSSLETITIPKSIVKIKENIFSL